MQAHAQIVAALRGGDRSFALAEVDRLLSADPENSELLGLKALALAVSGRLDEAVDCARLAVDHSGTAAQRLKHAGNLARLLANAGRRQELADLPDMPLPDAAQLSDAEREATALENLCEPLLLADRHAFVTDFLAPVLDRPGVSWTLEHLWLRAAAATRQYQRILDRCSAGAYRWRDRSDALAIACIAASELKRTDETERLYTAYLAAAPVYAAPRRDSQILTVVQIAASPDVETLTAPAVAQHFRGNFPSQLGKVRGDRYRLLSVFVGSPPRAASDIIGGGPAIVLNNCVNGEDLKRGELAKVEAHERALGLPVVNAAQKAVHCTRVETADTLRGIANLIVPKAMRFRLEARLLDVLRLRIKELFPLPVIMRSVGEQEGANIHLARNDAELGAALSELQSLGGKDFYVIQYAGVEHERGFFRRLRAGFVEGVPTLIRADYDDQWMVRGRKFDRILDHYRRDPALFEHANDLVRKPQWMGDAAWQTLLEVGRRIPLDVFGMDFDVDDQGRVVFFETNATMLLLSNAPPDLDYPQEAQQAFLKRLDALFMKRAGMTLQ